MFLFFWPTVIDEANWLTLSEDIQKPGEGFDAVICLGNSFAHLPDFKGRVFGIYYLEGILKKCHDESENISEHLYELRYAKCLSTLQNFKFLMDVFQTS